MQAAGGDAAAIIPAAGRGERLGASQNKAFIELAGRPLLSYALDAFRACPAVVETIVAVAPQDVERARGLLRAGGRQSERVVAGAALRQQSVAAALAEVRPDLSLVAVHDAARPFVTPGLIQRCLEEAARSGAGVAAVRATDTVKEADADGTVCGTLDRSRIWLVQTPQAFRRTLLEKAHASAAAAGVICTDDAGLVERLGHPVHLVEGDSDNIKVTFPRDVAQAEQGLLMGRRRRPLRDTIRCGIGFDAHTFADDRPLVLGGVLLRESGGLLGHSDADVVCHAVCDALLGAIAAGDIGTHFPDSDPAYRGISSLSLLARVADIVHGTGWEVQNLDVVVIAEEPKLAPHRDEMCRALADAVGIAPDAISLKGKTTEGMGFTGRREGIAAQALATVRPIYHPRRRAVAED